MVSVLSLAVNSVIVSAISGGIMSFAHILELKEYVFWAVIATICAVCGQSFTNMGFEHCRAAPGALIRTLDLPCVYILGVILLGEVPTLKAGLGAVMVFVAIVLVIGSQIWEERRQRSVCPDTESRIT